MDADKIGKFIKQLRTEKKLSQYQLADKIPITRQAVSKWERGVSIPDSSTLIELSKIFNVSIDELLTGERINKDTPDKFKKMTLNMVDENISKGKKIRKIILINVVIFIVLALLFFLYYFINSYNSIKFYNVKGRGNVFTQSSGILIFTKQKVYFQSGKLEYDDKNIKIKELKLYFSTKNKSQLIYSSQDSNFLIIDYYGYNLYFKYKDIDKLIKNLYLEIVYDDNKKERIHLNVTNQFSNNDLFTSKFKYLIEQINTNIFKKETGIIKEEAEEILENKVIETSAKNEATFKNDEEQIDDKNIKNNDVVDEKINKDKNETEKEYEKILSYLENKDLMIEVIKRTFTLEHNEGAVIYTKKYKKDNSLINFSYTQDSNYFNIYVYSDNKKYECFWGLDYDLIKLTIYENENLVNEIYIMRNDILQKNEKYQLLADIIFEYLEFFLE